MIERDPRIADRFWCSEAIVPYRQNLTLPIIQLGDTQLKTTYLSTGKRTVTYTNVKTGESKIENFKMGDEVIHGAAIPLFRYLRMIEQIRQLDESFQNKVFENFKNETFLKKLINKMNPVRGFEINTTVEQSLYLNPEEKNENLTLLLPEIELQPMDEKQHDIFIDNITDEILTHKNDDTKKLRIDNIYSLNKGYHGSVTYDFLAGFKKIKIRYPTPLCIAVCGTNHEKGDPNLVKQLLDAKADVNFPSDGNLTPIHLAAFANDIEVLELLLTHHQKSDDKIYTLPNVNVLTDNDEVLPKPLRNTLPILLAIKNNNVKMVDLLLEHGAKDSLRNASYAVDMIDKMSQNSQKWAMTLILKKHHINLENYSTLKAFHHQLPDFFTLRKVNSALSYLLNEDQTLTSVTEVLLLFKQAREEKIISEQYYTGLCEKLKSMSFQENVLTSDDFFVRLAKKLKQDPPTTLDQKADLLFKTYQKSTLCHWILDNIDNPLTESLFLRVLNSSVPAYPAYIEELKKTLDKNIDPHKKFLLYRKMYLIFMKNLNHSSSDELKKDYSIFFDDQYLSLMEKIDNDSFLLNICDDSKDKKLHALIDVVDQLKLNEQEHAKFEAILRHESNQIIQNLKFRIQDNSLCIHYNKNNEKICLYNGEIKLEGFKAMLNIFAKSNPDPYVKEGDTCQYYYFKQKEVWDQYADQIDQLTFAQQCEYVFQGQKNPQKNNLQLSHTVRFKASPTVANYFSSRAGLVLAVLSIPFLVGIFVLIHAKRKAVNEAKQEPVFKRKNRYASLFHKPIYIKKNNITEPSKGTNENENKSFLESNLKAK